MMLLDKARTNSPATNRTLQFSLDIIISLVSFYISYLLFYPHSINDIFYDTRYLVAYILIARTVLRFIFRINHQIWRYIGLNESKLIAQMDSVGSLGLLIFIIVLNLNIGVVLVDWLLNIFAHITIRSIRRIYAQEKRLKLATQYNNQKRILIVGAGEAGILYSRQIQLNNSAQIVGFIDDDIYKLNQYINGIRVIGTTKQIGYIAKEYVIDEIIICIPSGDQALIKSIIDNSGLTRAKIKIIPSLDEILENINNISRAKDVEIEDLLGRKKNNFSHLNCFDLIHNKTILIAGAGGSIGSELSIQVAKCKPKVLLLLDHDEFNIYNIERKLKEQFSQLKIVPLIVDIRNRERLEAIFKKNKPNIVLHAAAYKHVPLMESNITESITTNVFGTLNLSIMADKYHSVKFLLISSDKAVHPTSVMGTTKRIAEMIIQNISRTSSTKFMSVRFGNVLSSRGSVIPLFKEQIASGGPVTVTHPDMVRYFMTISEAVSLVLESVNLGKGGERFVLDMGEPIKIDDLAKDLIQLSGFNITDIKIKYIGIRPGEKLFEEPLSQQEKNKMTSIRKIFISQNDFLPPNFDTKISKLKNITNKSDLEIKLLLKDLVESYNFNK